MRRDAIRAPLSIMSIRWLCALTLVAIAACARPSSPARVPPSSPAPASKVTEPELIAIDMFGTEQITLEKLLATYGTELRAFAEGMMHGDPKARARTAELLDKLSSLGDFAEVLPSLVALEQSGRMAYYLTVDFVDRADAERRMPFFPPPTGSYPDPGGLIADWLAYEALAHTHPSRRRVDCPAFHCLGGDADAQAKQLAAKFDADVPSYVNELATILRDDRNGQHRAAAAYLLAYANDGRALVTRLVPAFRDSSSLVRNNAMRVVADIASFHPEVPVPLDPVLEALDYPLTTDRNKAAAILDGLLARPNSQRLHRMVATRAGTTLLAMLRLQQPNNHDYAYRILKRISGQSFGPRDYQAWEAWLRAQ